MNASKENAAEALDRLISLVQRMDGESLRFVREFLEAAMKKLPKEESFAKEKIRRKPKE